MLTSFSGNYLIFGSVLLANFSFSYIPQFPASYILIFLLDIVHWEFNIHISYILL